MRKDRHKQNRHKKGGDRKTSAKPDRQANRKAGVLPAAAESEVHSEQTGIPTGRPNDESDAVDRETAEHSEFHQKFSRRKIESNWDKYQELSDDDHAKIRGSDFTTLLNQSGAADTQFRLHDEKDWEDETEKSQSSDKVLSLDINALSLALMQVPIHTRLQIEADIFQGSQEEGIEEITKKFDQTLCQGSHSSSSTNHTLPSTGSEKDAEIKNRKTLHVANIEKHTDLEKVTSIQRTSELPEKQKKQLKADIAKTVRPETTVKVKETVVKETESDEDELEFLLNLDTPQTEKQDNQLTESNPVQDENSVDQQEQHSEEETKDSESCGKVPEKSVISEPTSDELEDWLDSVLDD
ncbi:cell death regulator Aven-like isoform X1 [Ptychodera flava]|uniref:cell death regulator Aven-like isoform X1 n=1 Tax=Ptychodera flava TaxID=63121 RepID=UPI00396A8CC8